MNAALIVSLFCQQFSPGKTDPGIYQAGPESHLGGEETPCVVLLTVSLLIVTEQDFSRPHQITRHRSQHTKNPNTQLDKSSMDGEQHRQQDVDHQVAAAAPHHQHRDGREEEGEDEGDQPGHVRHPGCLLRGL